LLLTAGAGSYLALSASIALRAFVHDVSYAEATGYVRADLINLTLAQLIGMGGALALGLHWFFPETTARDALRLGAVPRRALALCLLAGACLQFPLAELSNLLHAHVFGPEPLERQLALQEMIEARSLGHGVIVIACLVAAVPAMEELLFRGLLLFGLERRYGAAPALLFSSCMFGVSHLGAVPAVYATVAGLFLGALALKTRSVWPSIATHAAVNAMPILVPERVLPMSGFNVPSAVPQHLPVWLVVVTLVLGLGLLSWATRIEYTQEP
jgi:membrane protease YdiL (CAAX protease family)